MRTVKKSGTATNRQITADGSKARSESEYTVHYGRLSGDLPAPAKVYKDRRGGGREYLALYCGYDTETTTRKDGGKWRACVYIFQLSIFNFNGDNRVYLMRTWDDFIRSIEYINQYYQLNERRHVVLGVANLGFEFAFMAKRLKWNGDEYSFFAKECRKPLLCTCGGVQFREILSISGGSLEYTAKHFCQTKKLVGDMDYSVSRNSKTPLTDQEEQYCINDVVIVSEYMKYLFDRFLSGRRKKLPMTKTGILDDEIKQTFKHMCKDLDRKKAFPDGVHEGLYKQYLFSCFPNQEDYTYYFRWLFRGGYVHASALYTDIEVPDVRQKDIISSYPEWFFLGYCPRGKFRHVPFESKYLDSKCCIIHAIFYEIEITTVHTIESKNKIINCKNARFDNGRLIRADMIEVLLTELDYDIYKKFMKWDEKKSKILDFQIADRQRYPRYLTEVLKKYYKQKAELKRAGMQDTPEYSNSKEMVNAGYGLNVKRMREDKWVYNGDWYADDASFDFYKEVSSSVLLPQYGWWIAAGARHNLLSVVYALEKAGVHVVYCDTDSIKHRDHPAAAKIFKRYNNRVAKLRRSRGYREGCFIGLGEYSDECDGRLTRIKTMGAKRYIYEDQGKIKATIAGMPKVSIHAIGKDTEQIFQNFSRVGFTLETDESEKLTTAYSDEPYDMIVSGEKMHEESGVALYQIPFKLTIKEEYITYFQEIQNSFRAVL